MNPTLRTTTLAALKVGVSKFSPQMKIAAKYVLDHPLEFGLDPIRETARKASVSTYTLINMAKSLDFESFEALRQPFRTALLDTGTGHANSDWLVDVRSASDTGAVFAEAAVNTVSVVTNSLERQQLEIFEAVSELLFSAQTVYLTAVRSTYAVAYYLHYAGRMALPNFELIPRHQNSAIDDLSTADENDVLIAITVSPYSRETIEACAYAKQKGIKLILITDSELVSADFEPDYTLVASVFSTHNFGCLSGMMAVSELLTAFLMHHGGTAARDRIKTYEKTRIDNNAYWVAKKNIR